jgi:hypothetical protein
VIEIEVPGPHANTTVSSPATQKTVPQPCTEGYTNEFIGEYTADSAISYDSHDMSNIFEFSGLSNAGSDHCGSPFEFTSADFIQKGFQSSWSPMENNSTTGSTLEHQGDLLYDLLPTGPSPQPVAVLTEHPPPVNGNGEIDVDPPSGSIPNPVPPSTDRIEETTRQLSDLISAFLKLETTLSSGFWAKMFESPTAVVAMLNAASDPNACLTKSYPVVEIFEITQKFIEAVKQVGAFGACPTSTRTSPPSPPLPSSASDAYRQCTSHYSHSRQHSSPYDSSSEDAASTISSTSSTSSSSIATKAFESVSRNSFVTASGEPHGQPPAISCSQPVARIDFPTLLMIATCYVRILGLYTIFFRHINQFILALSSIAASKTPDNRANLPPILPPWPLGGFQPAHCGNLQILLVTQTSCFLLGQIESALGIDEWESSVIRGGISSNFSQQDTSSRYRHPRNRHSVQGNSRSRRDGREAPSTESSTHVKTTSGAHLSWEMIEMVTRQENSEGDKLEKLGTLRKSIKKVKKQLKKNIAL